MADLADEAVPEKLERHEKQEPAAKQDKPKQGEPKQDKPAKQDKAAKQDEAAKQDGAAKQDKAGAKAKPAAKSGFSAALKKRWRAWLRAVHRDVGYLAVGFTLIYALSGIAMNHLEDWDPNFRASEVQLKIAPIPDDLSDEEAVARVTAVAGISGTPSDVLRAGDEVRLEYPNGSKVTAIGESVTVQKRDSRFFFRIANWLHATRGKAVWKYISDAYAVLLLYLAISGLFMIKGKLGLRWRGTLLMSAGLAIPLAYIVIAGGPDSQKTDPKDPKAASASPSPNSDGIRLLPPDPEPAAADGAEAIEAPQRPPILKQPPPAAADTEAPQRPPVLKQPPADDAAESPQRPPVLKQPPPGA
jgi:hypothetical protein